jgi:hypothetical protein
MSILLLDIVFQPITFTIVFNCNRRGGAAADDGFYGKNGTITGTACPKGLHGIFCKECPSGTFKNVTGSDPSLCRPCPVDELPTRAVYVTVRGINSIHLYLELLCITYAL